MKKHFFFLLSLSLTFTAAQIWAQAVPMPSWHAGEIKAALKKSQVLGSVLYMAAHPDDENTRFIAYAAKGLGLRTGYLSLTRGDGGQNLIGKEVRELLGIIRTQELLAARRTDGGEQFFSRANDFGYSKNPEETMEIWERDAVLADAVWNIRKFRPDVIVTRFSPDRGGRTHGHHTASAILAVEAAKAAANPERFPEQLELVSVWQTKRVVWNTSWWFFREEGDNFDPSKYMQVDIGTYNPLLGTSYNEISSHSRTMHKSQGFGSAISRGSTIEYFQHLYGDSATSQNLFEGVDMTWERVQGSKKVAQQLQAALENFDMENPATILPQLTSALQELRKLKADNYWVKQKTKEVEELILQCAGVWTAITSDSYYTTPNDSVSLTATFLRRGKMTVNLSKLSFNGESIQADSSMAYNKLYEMAFKAFIPADASISQHYWLRDKASKGMFKVAEQKLIGLPENPWAFTVTATFSIGEKNPIDIDLPMPVLYRWTDPVDGERHRPLEITPLVTANLDQPTYIFGSDAPKPVQIRLKSFKDNMKGKLSLALPQGWKSEPSMVDFDLAKKGAEDVVDFKVFPPANQSVAEIVAQVEVDGQVQQYSLLTIDYAHIPIQTLFPVAKAKAVRLDIKKEGKRIGYIMGAGDAIPEALEQIGYQVDILSDADINLNTLQRYDAVIAGVRAYNTNERMNFHHEELMKYVEGGGNYIVQYNTSFRLKSEALGPYPLTLSRGRVTVEEAPVRLLDPNHVILQYPNEITEKDFSGWVQERGLYFPGTWDERYTPILSSNDPDEEALEGGLLVTDYGKGTFIYSGYSWFRELPAGVPGAYRLFINMISYKQYQKEERPLKDKQ